MHSGHETTFSLSCGQIFFNDRHNYYCSAESFQCIIMNSKLSYDNKCFCQNVSCLHIEESRMPRLHSMPCTPFSLSCAQAFCDDWHRAQGDTTVQCHIHANNELQI